MKVQTKILRLKPTLLYAGHNRFIIGACLLLLILVRPFIGVGQEKVQYEEIGAFLKMQRVDGQEIAALIRGENVLLSITDVFNFLKIKNTPSPGLDSVFGFFIDAQATYVIDKKNNRIQYQGKIFELKPDDLIATETSLYLSPDCFSNIFGLASTFSFRSLAVTMQSSLDLPVIREMRQEMVRRNIKKLKGEIKADSTIGHKHPFFSIGAVDWSVLNSHETKGKTDTRFNLTIGSVLAGGEATISFSQQSNVRFKERQQYYLWRYVNNDNYLLRQVRVGKIAAQATSSIYDPVVGVQFTNTPTTYRRSFGTYTLSNHTKPDWIVELYVNNIMIDYVKADASGFFTFEVPLMYGNSNVKLRFYGPNGEEQSGEENISIPFNMLPAHTMEYTVSAGIVEDQQLSKFSKAILNYGLNQQITVGGGMEYLSSVTSGKSMPFLNTTLRLASGLLASGEYTYGVKSMGTLTYRQPSNLQLELNYIKYTKGQKAINRNYLEERKVVLSLPIRTHNFVLLSKLTLNDIISSKVGYTVKTSYRDIPKTEFTSAELMLWGSFSHISTNFTTSALFRNGEHSHVYSDLSLSYKLRRGFVFRPLVRFDYNDTRFSNMKYEVEKRMSGNGFLNLSYQKDLQARSTTLTLGLRFDFSFARTTFMTSRSNKTITLIQSASGSLIGDGKTNFITAKNRSSVGKGGITLLPFLDINCNGKREENEPQVSGLKYHIKGGRILSNDEDDAIIRVIDLEPYVNYLVELDGNSFGNIAWQIKNKTLSVAIDPNQMKLVEVPVAVMGEASGMVYLNKDKEQKGLGRVIVAFYDSSSKRVAQTLTEGDGYFSYLGLPPGSYTARIDSAQLHNLNMAASPEILSFKIASSEEGVVADGFAFVLQSLSDTIEQQVAEQEKLSSAIQRKKEAVPQEKLLSVLQNDPQSKVQKQPKAQVKSQPQPAPSDNHQQKSSSLKKQQQPIVAKAQQLLNQDKQPPVTERRPQSGVKENKPAAIRNQQQSIKLKNVQPAIKKKQPTVTQKLQQSSIKEKHAIYERKEQSVEQQEHRPAGIKKQSANQENPHAVMAQQQPFKHSSRTQSASHQQSEVQAKKKPKTVVRKKSQSFIKHKQKNSMEKKQPVTQQKLYSLNHLQQADYQRKQHLLHQQRQQLIQEYHLSNKNQQQVVQKVQQLIKEQQLLIQKQRQLIMEIQQLKKLQLQLKKQKPSLIKK